MPTRKLSKEEEQQIMMGLFLGPLLWFIHLNVINILTSVSCKWGWFPFTVAGMSGLRFVEMLISLVALVLMLYLVYLSWRNWSVFQGRQSLRNPHLLQDTEEDRRPLLAFIAMLINAMFSIFILGNLVLLFFLKACGSH